MPHGHRILYWGPGEAESTLDTQGKSDPRSGNQAGVFCFIGVSSNWYGPGLQNQRRKSLGVRVAPPLPSCSLTFNNYAAVAQSVEHILGKDEVVGSIPIGGSIMEA